MVVVEAWAFVVAVIILDAVIGSVIIVVVLIMLSVIVG